MSSPLSHWAIEELQKLKVMSNGARYVLPSDDSSAPIDPKYITRSVARCLRRFKKYGVSAFTPHDLRRTGRTGLARLGVRIDIAERVLNHARERIEATYDLHEYIDEKRDALGVAANAAPRVVRGQSKRATRDDIYRAKARRNLYAMHEAVHSIADELSRTRRINDPAHAKLAETRRCVVAGWMDGRRCCAGCSGRDRSRRRRAVLRQAPAAGTD